MNSYGNGLAETRTYDQDYRLTGITIPAIESWSLGYNADDDITGVTDNLSSSNNQILGYDNLNRLNAGSGNYGSLSYKYHVNCEFHSMPVGDFVSWQPAISGNTGYRAGLQVAADQWGGGRTLGLGLEFKLTFWSRKSCPPISVKSCIRWPSSCRRMPRGMKCWKG